MKKKAEKQMEARALLAEIRAKLSIIESHLMWMITAEQRFRIGQRVEFSRRARERGFPKRKRSEKGFVKAVNSFSVVVKLDGYKQTHSYHHAFFNSVSGPKLF